MHRKVPRKVKANVEQPHHSSSVVVQDQKSGFFLQQGNTQHRSRLAQSSYTERADQTSHASIVEGTVSSHYVSNSADLDV